LRDKEAHAEELRREDAALQEERARIASEAEARAAKERGVAQLRYGRQLQRQHKQMLLQKSRALQADIAADLAAIENVVAEAARDRDAQTARRRQAAADVEWMREQVRLQLEREKQRERELEAYHQDEGTRRAGPGRRFCSFVCFSTDPSWCTLANRLFARREAEWDREQRAREKLMSEVYQERAQQVEENLVAVRRAREESLRDRDELLKALEAESEAAAREEQSRHEQTSRRRAEVDDQVARQAALRAEAAEQERQAAEARR
jgi:trichoplein keratin filament-binding protein